MSNPRSNHRPSLVRNSTKSLSSKSVSLLQLAVRVGSSQENLEIFTPNDEAFPFKIDTELFEGFVQVRIKDFGGIGHSSEQKHPFSIQIQGNFKKEMTANDVVWSWEALEPLKIPSIFAQFLRVVAPHTMFDFDAKNPFIQSFAITASSLMQVWPKKLKEFQPQISEDISPILPPHLQFKPSRTLFSSEETHSVQIRRKLFIIEENRNNTIFHPNQTIGKHSLTPAFETFNGYIDLNNLNVEYPQVYHMISIIYCTDSHFDCSYGHGKKLI
jgi:Protein of unknown function (DUF1769)